MKKLLIVEDVPMNRELLTQLLEDLYELEFAFDGEQALSMIFETAYDGVLLDISLPKLDGFGVAREVRLDGLKLPIIAVTAHAMNGVHHRIIEAGCNDCVTKPIDEEILYASIRKYIG